MVAIPASPHVPPPLTCAHPAVRRRRRRRGDFSAAFKGHRKRPRRAPRRRRPRRRPRSALRAAWWLVRGRGAGVLSDTPPAMDTRPVMRRQLRACGLACGDALCAHDGEMLLLPRRRHLRQGRRQRMRMLARPRPW